MYIITISFLISYTYSITCGDLTNFEITSIHYELCQFRGIYDSSSCECNCQYGFETINKDSNLTMEHLLTTDILVGCTHKRKRKSVAFFLSLFFPFGFDYLYLKRYYFFVPIFLVNLCFLVYWIICYFYVNKLNEADLKLNTDYNSTLNTIVSNSKVKAVFDSQKDSKNIDPHTNNNSICKEKKDSNCQKITVLKTIRLILLVIFCLYWVLDIFLMGFGIIKDDKGFSVINDIKYLFQIKK